MATGNIETVTRQHDDITPELQTNIQERSRLCHGFHLSSRRRGDTVADVKGSLFSFSACRFSPG